MPMGSSHHVKDGLNESEWHVRMEKIVIELTKISVDDSTAKADQVHLAVG